MQSVKLVLAATEFELDGQEVQAELPIVFLYLPASHAVQECCIVYPDMSGPVYPTLHICTRQLLLKGPRSLQLIQK